MGKRGLINADKRGHVAYAHFAHGKGGNYAKSPRVGECGERLGGIRECGVRGEILFDERFRARVEQSGAPFLSEYIVLFYYHKTTLLLSNAHHQMVLRDVLTYRDIHLRNGPGDRRNHAVQHLHRLMDKQ